MIYLQFIFIKLFIERCTKKKATLFKAWLIRK